MAEAFPTVSVGDHNLTEFRTRPLPFEIVDDGSVTLEELAVPSPAGAPDVPIRLYRSVNAAGPLGCIFHIHGGGYVGGSAKEMEFLQRPLAAMLGCVIVSIDYRLAPETRFPGAIEDCYTALSWLFGEAANRNIDPARIGVMGESAGGGLAAALAMMARDRGHSRSLSSI